MVKKRRKKFQIDRTDAKIIKILYEDGRESLVSIGEQVNLTHPSVKERLKKLVDAEIIKIQANMNLKKLGFSVGFVFMEISDPQSVGDVIEKLAECPRILMMGYTSGIYNLILIVVAPNPDILRAFVEKNLRSIPNIRRLDFSLGEIASPKFFPMRIILEEKYKEKCDKCIFKKTLNLCPGCRGIMEEIKNMR